MKKWFRSPVFLIALSAICSALPYTFSSLFFLSWFSFVPLFTLLYRAAPGFRKALGRGFLFGFLYHAAIYFWFLVMYPMEMTSLDKGQAALTVAVAWLGSAVLHGVLFIVPFLLADLMARWLSAKAFRLFAAAGGILLAEEMMSWGSLAFPWIRVSLGQYRVPVLIQLASLFGAAGVDLIILCVNVFLALAIVEKGKRKWRAGIFALGLFTANLVLGLIFTGSPIEGTTAKISAVQGRILSGEKWEENSAAYCFETYTSLTEEAAAENPDLVVWPESAVPTGLSRSGGKTLASYQALSKKIASPILMGCFWYENDSAFNAAVLIDETGVSEPYAKRHLVPFGEYVPYREWIEKVFPFVGEIDQLTTECSPGESTALFETEFGKIGAVICFESIFPKLVRDSVADGASLLVIVTNDSWYKDSPAVTQHLAQAVFRSVENGRATVQSANSGVSAFIDPHGRITSELGALQKGVLTDTVTFCEGTTLFHTIGDVVLPLYLICLAAAGLFLLGKEKRRTR